MNTVRIIRYVAWAAVVVLLGVIGYVSFAPMLGLKETITNQGVASIGGPFTLVDASTGETVTEADFKGKPSAYFFGFTFCPDVCPTTLAETQQWLQELGPDADKINFAFVTVDPERDTAEVLRDYVGVFDKRIHPLTGSREQIDEIIRNYRVYARKVPLDDGDYTMDHSAAVYLMKPDNTFFGTIAYGENPENAMAKLRRLIDTAG
ncbi:MAG: SCO family protein [Stappia sp.]|jgi:protein SCO1/2|uniref:SCO family protein n=1 Tax=Stappia sp. TaxID=1870903 RepID=UPI000C6C1D36|nr:SCO family protein [Stappia sp.]MAA97933.1 SCO family protein [Stappia sp.]MBM19653.1 SCO family protein [Stappia sp.]